MTSPLRRPGSRRRAEGLPADRLPPGQYLPRGWPVLHYGRVPPFTPDTWDLTVSGATADGREHAWSWPEFEALPTVQVRADLHCVTRFSVLDNDWAGVAATTMLERVPPAPGVEHVLVVADYGYSANLLLSDLTDGDALFATHRGGEALAPDHGYPLRLVVPHLYAWKGPKWVRGLEYLTEDRRGFWEERGYHNRADPWLEQRYGYQERPGDGPRL